MKIRFSWHRAALALCAATLPGTASIHAQGDSPRPVPGKEYKLAHTSSFSGVDGARNPFWPIGWVPTAPNPTAIATPQQTAPDVTADSFVVTSISLDGQPLAVVNGRTYGVGDRIPVNASGTEAVAVSKILDGAVVFTYHGHEIRSFTTRRGGGAR